MMFSLLARLCAIAFLTVASTPNISVAQIWPEGGMSFDQLQDILLNHPYAQSTPECRRYKADKDNLYRLCGPGGPRYGDAAYCKGLINAGSGLIDSCSDAVDAEHKRQVAAKANAGQGSSQGTAQVGQCVAFSKVQERDSFGNPSCGIRAENNCSVATQCQLEMTGVDSQGRRHPSRQAIHLRPGETGARTINNVLACENLQGQCKPSTQ
ncbi:hypothetical protein IB237_26055 [Agrobacterium sp. AGB01]|uniref:hypothetical protein n=1 Tax=Agrobacterium sp. AGB01 TaxID=2769302 RepID=UPI001784B166|nr:hypothetical protein [Agrobacterium sp. AGB01]MBD9390665.1 hypothetical protein [Agrobacterium sp. AGB01]